MSEDELDLLMERIRGEIAARKVSNEAALQPVTTAIAGEDVDVRLPRFPAIPRLGRKTSYTLDDFLGYHDEEFIRYAYHRILGREPDRAGADIYLELLRSGQMGKADILATLRFSSEGKARAATIEGLGPGRHLAGRLRRFPIVGYLIDLVGGLIRLPRYMEAVRRTESFAAANHHQARHVVDSLVAQLETELATLRGLSEVNRHAIAELGAAVQGAEGVESRIHDLRRDAGRLEQEVVARLGTLDAQFDGFQQPLGEIREMLDVHRRSMEEQLADIENRMGGWKRALIQIERAVAESPNAGEAPARPVAPSETRVAGFDRFYADFEDRFRGTREDISGRQKVYLPYLSEQRGKPVDNLPAIDLGCGRGEWLELLREEGVPAKGIDMNRSFLAENRERGLDVIEADAVEYLHGLSDGSVRAITGFHIIEHLQFERLVDLIDESARVLGDGGIAIFETPNPENLVTAACNFYSDPTHVRPIPPHLAAHLLEARGFSRVEIVRLHEAEIPESENIESPTVRRLLFGPQDYAVIGFK